MSDMKCPNIKIYKCSDGFVTDNAQVAKSHEANIKSNKLICPFCQQELNDNYYMCCNNPHCNKTSDMFGTEELWQELIRTRKALDVAISTLTVIGEGCVIEHSVVGHEDDNKIKLAKIALDKIKTALEQKDK